jgi:serine O-acetyltransferase
MALSAIWCDLARLKERRPPFSSRDRFVLLVTTVPTLKGMAVIGFRLSHSIGERTPLLGVAIKQMTQLLTGADVDYRATVAPGFCLPHPVGVVVSGGARLGRSCTIHQGATVGSRPAGSPTLGDHVNVGPGARILGPIRLGSNVHVAANCVVTKSFVMDDVILAGVPATVIGRRRCDNDRGID